MDDENKLRDVDTRVRRAVSPPGDVVDRVVLRALTGSDSRPRPWRHMTVAVVTIATVVLLVALNVWQGRKRAGEHTLPTSLVISGSGSMLVVESQDGRRWIVGPASEHRIGGGYVIVVPQ